MSDAYTDARREPAKPHQCAHWSEEDGTRCRATAMHNQIMCFHHRVDDIPTVIENDPFLLENLDTREAIQRALGQVAARLACNHMDFERAKLLLQTINSAMRNLPPHPRPTRQSAAQSTQPATEYEQPATQDEAPPPPERAYTAEEKDFFHHTIAATGFQPGNYPRPASVADEDIIARVNECRGRYHFPPLKPKKDALGRLIYNERLDFAAYR